MADAVTLNVEVRTALGKKNRALRRQGITPIHMYGLNQESETLQVGRIDILVMTRSVYVVGRQVFTSHGLDPRDYDLVVVKSPNGFRTYYEEIASAIVPIDVPGSTSANLKSLPFENCPRPIFPLDEEVRPAFLETP